MPIPKNYKTKEAAAYMEMSVDALENLAQKGLVVRFKIGGQWRYNEKDLDDYYSQQHQSGVSTAAQLKAERPPVRLRRHERKRMTIEEALKCWD